MKSCPESLPNHISVVIADDHPVVREGLAAILETESDLMVVGEATDGEEALKMCGRHHPDVLLLDLRMPRKAPHQIRDSIRKVAAGECVLSSNVQRCNGYTRQKKVWRSLTRWLKTWGRCPRRFALVGRRLDG